MERVQENYIAANNHHHQELAAVPDAGTLTWCGYLLITLSVVADWAGLTDGPGAAFFAYVLLLLGCGFLCLAMLAPAKPKEI